MASSPLSVREQRMLLSILELEHKQAEATCEQWMAEPDDSEDEEQTAERSYNRAYFRGAATAYLSAKRLIEELLNG